MEFLRIGKIVDTHGMDGDIKILPITDNPEFFNVLEFFMLSEDGKVVQSLDITSIRPQNGLLICNSVQLTCYDDALDVKGLDVVVPENMLPDASDGEVYWRDIEGSSIITDEGKKIGTLVDYIESGSSDVFRIEDEKGSFYLISNNPEHVLKIDASVKLITINEEGLVSEEV